MLNTSMYYRGNLFQEEMAEWLWRQTVNLLNFIHRRFESFSPQLVEEDKNIITKCYKKYINF